MELLLIFFIETYVNLYIFMEKITEREKIILKLIALGLDNKEIGENMAISSHTVKAHISSIINKLNAKNRTNVVYIALKNKLIK